MDCYQSVSKQKLHLPTVWNDGLASVLKLFSFSLPVTKYVSYI